MRKLDRTILCGVLLFLAVCLTYPGLMGIFNSSMQYHGLIAQNIDALNQLKSFYSLLLAIGLIALWCSYKPEKKRDLIIALGLIMVLSAISRGYSLIFDGMPSTETVVYLIVELLLAIIFISLPSLSLLQEPEE